MFVLLLLDSSHNSFLMVSEDISQYNYIGVLLLPIMYKLTKYGYFLTSSFTPPLPEEKREENTGKQLSKWTKPSACRIFPCFLMLGSLKNTGVWRHVHILSSSLTSCIYTSQGNIIIIHRLSSRVVLGSYQNNRWLNFLISKMKMVSAFTLQVIIWNKGAIILLLNMYVE